MITLLKKNITNLLGLLLGVVVLKFYWGVTSFDFLNFDDPIYVTKNAQVLSGLSRESVLWAFSTHTMGHWHPLTWLSHMLDITLFGLDPWGHHFTSVLIFAVCAASLFKLLLKFKFQMEWVFLGVAFFCLHPLRLESVAWVSERKDVLSFMFGLWALISYAETRSPDQTQHSKKISTVNMFVFFLLSLLCKPTFVSLPVLCVLLDQYFFKEHALNKNKCSHAGMFLISMIFCLQALYTQSAEGALKQQSFLSRLEMSVVSLSTYFTKFFYPNRVAIFYPLENHSVVEITIRAFLILALTVFLFFKRKSWSLVWVGWLWFLVTAFPLSGFIPIGGQAYADRWTLLPHVGLVIAALFLLNQVQFSKKNASIALVILVSMAWVNLRAMPHFASSETVFREALRVTSNNFMAHTNLGVTLVLKGQIEEGHKHYEEAYRQNPDYPEAISNMGSVLARRGRLTEATVLFEKAVAKNPKLSSAKYNLGLAYMMQDRLTEGLTVWVDVLANDPTYDQVRQELIHSYAYILNKCPQLDKNKLAAMQQKWAKSFRNELDAGLVDRIVHCK